MILTQVPDFVVLVPSWEGNDTLPEAERIKITVAVPTLKEARKLVLYHVGTSKKIEPELNFDLFLSKITEVKNLQVGEKEIKNGSDMARVELAPIVEECFFMYQDILRKVGKKNK